METWPQLRLKESANCDALIVNHQHRLAVGPEQVVDLSDQLGPEGVSSTSMPAALIWSRMASAVAGATRRTRISVILLIPFYEPIRLAEDLAVLKAKLSAGLEQYRKDYAAYYERHKRPDSPAMRDPNPTVVSPKEPEEQSQRGRRPGAEDAVAVEVRRRELGVLLDEAAPGLDVIPHQDGEDGVRIGGLIDLDIGRIGPGEPDVLPDRAVEQVRVLADPGGDGGRIDVPHRLGHAAVDQHGAVVIGGNAKHRVGDFTPPGAHESGESDDLEDALEVVDAGRPDVDQRVGLGARLAAAALFVFNIVAVISYPGLVAESRRAAYQAAVRMMHSP